MYKIFLLTIFIVLSIATLATRNLSNYQLPNYLYMNSLNLDHHSITQSETLNDKHRLVFLGSSGVAGSNVPKESTLSDYFNQVQSSYQSYNLATLQGTMPEIMVYFKQSLKYFPQTVILGLSPDTLPYFSLSPVSALNIDLIQDDFDASLINRIKQEAKKKLFLNDLIEKFWPKYPPPQALIDFKTKLYYLKESFYGPLINKNFSGSFQHKIKPQGLENPQISSLLKLAKLCEEKRINLFIYFEPMYEPDKIFGDEFNQYQTNLKEIIQRHGIKLFDYTNLISDRHLFADYIHLKPQGYEKLAAQLAQDIKGAQQ